MWREKSVDNFGHNSTWVHTKGQNHEGRVSENTDFSSLVSSCFHLLVALASAASEYAQEMAPWTKDDEANLNNKSGLKPSEAPGQGPHS